MSWRRRMRRKRDARRVIEAEKKESEGCTVMCCVFSVPVFRCKLPLTTFLLILPWLPLPPYPPQDAAAASRLFLFPPSFLASQSPTILFVHFFFLRLVSPVRLVSPSSVSLSFLRPLHLLSVFFSVRLVSPSPHHLRLVPSSSPGWRFRVLPSESDVSAANCALL